MAIRDVVLMSYVPSGAVLCSMMLAANQVFAASQSLYLLAKICCFLCISAGVSAENLLATRKDRNAANITRRELSKAATRAAWSSLSSELKAASASWWVTWPARRKLAPRPGCTAQRRSAAAALAARVGFIAAGIFLYGSDVDESGRSWQTTEVIETRAWRRTR